MITGNTVALAAAATHLQKAVDRFDGIGEIPGKKPQPRFLSAHWRTTEAQTITASYLTEFKEVTP